MARFFVERLVLLATALAVVSTFEWVVAAALGLHRSLWTLIATAVVLLVSLRLWISWNPRGRRASRVKAASARWWHSHITLETEQPLVGAAVDGLAVFVAIALTGLLLQRDDLSLPAAAECGAIIFAFSATIGVVATRRERRRRAM